MSRQTFLSCSFKVRRVNLGKKDDLDSAFAEYHRLVYDGLAWGKLYLRKVRKHGQAETKPGSLTGNTSTRKRKKRNHRQSETKPTYTQNSIYAYLMKTRPKRTWDYNLFSTVRDDGLGDVARTIAGYLEVKKVQANAVYPSVDGGEQLDYSAALAGLSSLADDLAIENELRCQLLRKVSTDTRPILIDHRSVFTILATPDMRHYYLFVKLFPANCGRPKVAYSGLLDLRTGREFRHTATDTAILLPITVSKWQRNKFLAAMLRDGQAAIDEKLVGPPSLKLCRKVNRYGHHDYYAVITFGFDVPDAQEPSALLGVGSGILYNMALAVTDLKGNVLYTENSTTGLSEMKAASSAAVAEKQRRRGKVELRDYEGKARDHVLHNIANHIVNLALMRNAVIVLADTSASPPSSRKARKNWLTTPWKKLCFMVEYKAKLAGVKVRSGVFTARSTKICPVCAGAVTFDRGVGKCERCKREESINVIEAVNIARRYLYRKSEWLDRGGYIGFHQSFAK